MLDFWMEEFISSSSVELTKDFPFVVLGNKIDLKNKDKIFVSRIFILGRLNLKKLINGVDHEEI